MQANWSIILNVLLLIGVVIAIGRLLKARKQNVFPANHHPTSGSSEKELPKAPSFNDDIIAVRKVITNPSAGSYPAPELVASGAFKPKLGTQTPKLLPEEESVSVVKVNASNLTPSTLMIFLLAKNNRQFAGYELLQTVLAAGLRFGEGQLFHRHQFSNGQGPRVCSLAAATESGVFDLQNIGAFSVRGLCLFMETSNNSLIDEERFSIMLDTAKQLSEGMDAHLLDDTRKPLTEERMERYHRLLRNEHRAQECVTA